MKNVGHIKNYVVDIKNGFKYIKIKEKIIEKNIHYKFRGINYILLNVIIFIILIPMFLSKDYHKETRNLDSDYVIKITISGNGSQRIVSEKSELIPQSVKVSGQIGSFYSTKIIQIYGDESNDYTIKIEFDFQFLLTEKKYSFKSLFEGLTNLKSVDFSEMEYSRVTDASYMFKDCTNLKYIKFGKDFDTSSISYMEQMFANSGIISLDLSRFKTSSVENMNY